MSEVFLCSPPDPPFHCTYFSEKINDVIAHLQESHADIPEFRRKWGQDALRRLPQPATVYQVSPDVQGLSVLTCCDHYFLHRYDLLTHRRNTHAHHEETDDLIASRGEYGYEEAIVTRHSRILSAGAHVADAHITRQLQLAPCPVAAAPEPLAVYPAAAAPLLHRLAVKFTNPYHAPAGYVDVPAATASMVDMERAILSVYNGDMPIAWDALWGDGIVVRYTIANGEQSYAVLTGDEDVLALMAVMDIGECWVGNPVRGVSNGGN